MSIIVLSNESDFLHFKILNNLSFSAHNFQSKFIPKINTIIEFILKILSISHC